MEKVNQKQHSIPGGITEIGATIKGLEDAEVVIPTTYTVASLIWPVQELDGF